MKQRGIALNRCSDVHVFSDVTADIDAIRLSSGSVIRNDCDNVGRSSSVTSGGNSIVLNGSRKGGLNEDEEGGSELGVHVF